MMASQMSDCSNRDANWGRRTHRWFTIGIAGFAGIAATLLAGAPGQAATVKEIFQNYGLLGTYSVDCSQPVSEKNSYIVYRAIDDGHVQRDAMTSPTTRVTVHIVDGAMGIAPNEIEAHGTTTQGKPFSYVLRVDGQRERVMTWVEEGRTITNGIYKERNNYTMPWTNKCSSE